MPKKPKPFSRPVIDLGGPKKEWRKVLVAELDTGDLVAHVGKIKEIWAEEQYSSQFGRVAVVTLVAVDGTKALKRVDDIVEAFK